MQTNANTVTNVNKVFANRQALTAAVDALSCSITQDIAYDPVSCPCGHLFDRPAITTWLRMSGRCPVSQQPLVAAQLYQNLAIAGVITALGFSRNTPNEPVTTEDAATTMYVPSIVAAPYLACADERVGVPDLGREQIDLLSGGRLVCVQDDLINPQSDNVAWVRDFIIDNNRKVLNRLNPNPPGTYHHIVVRKYTYHHVSDDPSYVAYELARAGYFVYDVFSVHKNHRNTRYMLYSIEWKSDGSQNTLTKYGG